jgi:hypothetical protein
LAHFWVHHNVSTLKKRQEEPTNLVTASRLLQSNLLLLTPYKAPLRCKDLTFMKENVATKTHILSARQKQPKAPEFANSKGDCKIVIPPMFPPSLEKVSKLRSDDPGLQLEGPML